MAENDWAVFEQTAAPAQKVSDESPTWGDYGNAASSATKSTLGAGPAAGVRYLTEGDERENNPGTRFLNAASKRLQNEFNESARDDEGKLTEPARQRLTAMVSDPAFLAHPFSSVALKSVGMTPYAGATVVGALVGGPIGAAAVAGGLNSASVINDIYGSLDKPDAELQKINTYYYSLREIGMSEEDARADLKAKAFGLKPIINAVVGAAEGLLGPAGQIARAVGGKAVLGAANRGIAGRTAMATAQGAGTEFVQEGTAAASVQDAEIAIGSRNQYDPDAIFQQAATGAVVGAAVSGPAGAMSRGHAKAAPTAPKVEVVSEVGPNAEQGAALAASSPAVPTPAAAPVAAPVANGVFRPPEPATPPVAEPVPTAAPAEVAAVPAPVVAASKRLRKGKTAEAAPVITPEVTPGVTLDPEDVAVPPDVVDASRAVQVEAAKSPEPATVEPDLADPNRPRMVLPSNSPEAKAAEQLSKEAQDAAKPQLVEKVSVGSKDTKRNAKRAEDAEVAKTLFEELAPEKSTLPMNLAERHALRERLGAVLKRAEEAGVKILTKVGYEGTPDHVVWLREVQQLHTAMNKKSFVGARANEHMTAFLGREMAAKGGDFSVMRGERKAEGEANKRVGQGDVETMAAKPVAKPELIASETSSGEDEVARLETQEAPAVAPASGKGRVRGIAAAAELRRVIKKDGKLEEVEGAKAASGVRSVKLTDAERAKYETPGKGKAKVQEVKARIAAAATETNTDPTPKQAESGLYKKGRVSVQGIRVAIENPKGSIRRNKDPKGPKWEVKMVAHYGYDEDVEGADSTRAKKQKLDVFVGDKPDSKHVFVVDQQDLKTGKFDEHKVFVGYDDKVKVFTDYDKSFSDGRGMERIGAITEMSADDYKEWKKSGKVTDPAAELEPQSMVSAIRGPTDEQIRKVVRQMGPMGPMQGSETVQTQDGTRISTLHSSSLADALHSIKPADLGGVNAKMLPLVRARLLQLVPNVPLHYMSTDNMNTLIEHSAGSLDKSTKAFHSMNRRSGDDFVVVDVSKLRTPEETAHIVIHEAAHAATMHALLQDERHGGKVSNFIDTLMTYAVDVNPLLAKEYGLKNRFEFIAEALSNPAFQTDLSFIEVSDNVAASLNLAGWKKKSVWAATVDAIRRLLGMPLNYHSALDAILRVSDHLMEANVHARDAMTRGNLRGNVATENSLNAFKVLGYDTHAMFERAEAQEQMGSPKLLAVRTMDNIAQAAERYFGTDVVRRIADALEMTRVTAERFQKAGEPVLTKLHNLEQKYKGAVWDSFAALSHDATMTSVHPDRPLAANKHLGDDTLDGAWPKEQHARLEAQYKALPEDLKQAYAEARDFFTKRQNDMSLSIIRNRVLKALGVEDDALAMRIHENKTTDADEKLLGAEMLSTILDAKALSKISGPYFPLMRRGDYVVQAKYKITAPTTALRQIDANTWEFDDRDKALAWARKQDARPTVKSIWVDGPTGEKFVKDPVDGKMIRVLKEDIDAVHRFRVTVQDRHVEFFDTAEKAAVAAKEYEKDPVFASVAGVEQRRFEPGDRQADMLSGQLDTLMNSLNRRQSVKEMSSEQRHELEAVLNEASIRYLGSTRIQSRRLPRTYVAGASNDLTRNTLEYNTSSSGYMAKLEHQPAIEAAVKEMNNASKGDASKGTSLGRSTIAHEVNKRIASGNGVTAGSKYNEIFNRVLTASFLDKLFSPAYNVVNSLQPAMVTGPVLGGRFGMGRSFSALGQAYNDVAGYSIVKQGLRDTVQAAMNKGGAANYLDDIKARLKSPAERAMLDYLAERGSIDPDAGLEIAKLIKAKGGFKGSIDTGLGYLEGIARQMPRAIESINRTVTAVAAYRLELAKNGGNHDAAVRFAQETVNNTQGLYSNTNAAPVFNHPLAKLSLQFKKYGQMMYHLLGQQVGKAFHGATREERMEGIKTLAYISATHVAMAGTLGLPTEPFKMLLLGAKAAGLTALGWDDVERWEREATASVFGKTGGEVVSKGLPRLLGVDLSSRVGLDSLALFGSPRSDNKNDVKAYVFDLIAGAPGSLAGDWIAGANALTSGDVGKAAELMVPLKFASDSIKAYRLATEGKKSDTGRQLLDPVSVKDGIVQAMGFQPSSVAESGAHAAAVRGKAGTDRKARDAAIAQWVNAKGPDKVKAQRAVQEFNKTTHKDLRIEQKDLSNAAKRRAQQGSGVITNKRSEHVKDRFDQVFNVP